MWTALAGGVGGAKLARGLATLFPQHTDELRIIINTGDDFTLHGLHISPDIDTLLYTLGGIANPATGWGIVDDTFVTMDQLGKLGQDVWFRLGDRDLATHITRTRFLRDGETLTAVTQKLADALGISPSLKLIPMSDDPIATEIETPTGWMAFQDYFVRYHHEPEVRSVRLAGINTARPTATAIESISQANIVFFCPSNPIVSIGPILALPGMRAALSHRGDGCQRVAVSPIIGGLALKGPADRMLQGLGYESSAFGVAQIYSGLLDLFVIDTQDVALAPAIEQLGMRVLVTNTIMTTHADSVALATAIVEAL